MKTRMEMVMRIIRHMKLRIFSLALGLTLTAHAERESLISEDLYLRIDECIHDYYYPFVKSSDMPEAKALREKAFAGLEDREKIRALAEWMFRFPPPTHSGIPLNTGKLLIAPEPVISDYSELHRLMAVETDSRRFYQLSVLASAFGEKNGDNFMPDCARALFMEGKAADLGQSTNGHPLDSISNYWFSRITLVLREKNQTFKNEIYPKLVKLDFTQRNLALARWLKGNWPGCENLEIPSNSKNVQDSTTNLSEDSEERPPKAAISTDRQQNVLATKSQAQVGNTARYLLTSLAALSAIAAAWFVLRKQKKS